MSNVPPMYCARPTFNGFTDNEARVFGPGLPNCGVSFPNLSLAERCAQACNLAHESGQAAGEVLARSLTPHPLETACEHRSLE